MHKTTDEDWDPERLVFWCKSRCFACTKWQVRSGTHRDLQFWPKSRCSACINHWWGLGPIETSNSDAKHAVLHAQNHGEVWDTYRLVILVIKSLFWLHITTDEGWDEFKLAILVLITLFCMHWGLGTIETCNSSPKFTALHAKTTDEGWDTERQVILMLSMLFLVHKSAGEGWDPLRHVILVLKSLFCIQKSTGVVWDP